MERIVIKLTRQVKRHFHRTIKKIKDARLKTRYLIILHTAEGYSRRKIAEMLLCSASTVDRVRKRFAEKGIKDYQWRPIFAICCMIISISISVLFTSKFNKYWFFAIMFSFLNYIYKDARKASMGIIREQ